jgi:hypothetical protein
LGYGPFRLWWRQTVAELRHLDPSISPVAVSVLAAALVEGTLTFVVRHAKQLGLGVMGSKDFDRPATSWKIEDRVSSAAAGKESAILTTALGSEPTSLSELVSEFTPAGCSPSSLRGHPTCGPKRGERRRPRRS